MAYGCPDTPANAQGNEGDGKQFDGQSHGAAERYFRFRCLGLAGCCFITALAFDDVAGAFAVRAGRAAAVKDTRIVLVDDVMTTGATLTACIRPLLSAGAANIDVLTLARVTRTG